MTSAASAFEALGQAVDRRVLICESSQAGIDLHAGNFRVRNTGQQTKRSGACPTTSFKHMIPRLRRACGGKEYGVQTGSEPSPGLAQVHAAIQKSVTRKAEMTGHAEAGILKWRANAGLGWVDQVIAKTGCREEGYAFVPILEQRQGRAGGKRQSILQPS